MVSATSTFQAPFTPPGDFRVQKKEDAFETRDDKNSEPCEEKADDQQRHQSDANEESSFDKVACNKRIAGAFVGLMTSQDLNQAVASIAAIDVPKALQAEQLCDLLLFIVEAGADMVRMRTLGFKLIVAIYMERCWSKASLEEGLWNFGNLCASDKVHAEDLAKILGEELFTAFIPLFQEGIVPAELLMKVVTCKECQASTSSTSKDDAEFLMKMAKEGQASSSSTSDFAKDNRRFAEKRRKKVKKSLIDIAAEQQQQEQEALWRFGGTMAPSGCYVPAVSCYDWQY